MPKRAHRSFIKTRASLRDGEAAAAAAAGQQRQLLLLLLHTAAVGASSVHSAVELGANLAVRPLPVINRVDMQPCRWPKAITHHVGNHGAH